MDSKDRKDRKERNLDRAVNLAANGRIQAAKVVATAKEFDSYLESDA